MKKTYSVRADEEVMKKIDIRAKTLGLNRSSYLLFLATSVEGILGSQDKVNKESAAVVDALSKISSLGK
jgi:predicted ATP-dependent serine protease